MSMCAPPLTTASRTSISSSWRAPAWSTASCPAPASGCTRTSSPCRSARALTRPWAATSLQTIAGTFWRITRRPRPSGSSSAASPCLKTSSRAATSTGCSVDNERIRALCLGLPQVRETLNWGHHLVYWVGDREIGGKMFAMTDVDGSGVGVLSLHCGAERLHELLEREGVRPTPYLAKHFWVTL